MATGLGLLVIIGVWVVYNLVRPPEPRLVLRNGAQAGAVSLQLRNGLGDPEKPPARPNYRVAARKLARLLYVDEGLYAQASGGGSLSDEAVWREPAPRQWGDDLYSRLRLPPEDEYR